MYPTDLKYTRDHEWIRFDGGDASVGITDFAQRQLGDVVFVEVPEAGKTVSKGDEAAVVESVKAASDVYAPVAGEIVAVNSPVSEAPEQVNKDAYAAWFFRLRPVEPTAVAGLLDARAYEASIGDA